MGGCAGKKKSKSYETKSDLNKKPESKTKDDRVESKSQNLPLSNGSTGKTSEENMNDLNIQATIDQYDGINKAIGQIFSSRVVSITDSVLESELANLIYGNPANDYAENPLVVTTFKSTEV